MAERGDAAAGIGAPSRRVLLLLTFLIGASAPARADRFVDVTAAWAPPSLAGVHNGVGYFTLHYYGGPPDQLTGASTPVAERAELHRDEMNAGVMSMRPVGSLPLAAGSTVTLTPSGLHLMLIGLKQPLKPGDRFPLTLSFERQAPLTIEIEVRPTAPAQ